MEKDRKKKGYGIGMGLEGREKLQVIGMGREGKGRRSPKGYRIEMELDGKGIKTGIKERMGEEGSEERRN